MSRQCWIVESLPRSYIRDAPEDSIRHVLCAGALSTAFRYRFVVSLRGFPGRFLACNVYFLGQITSIKTGLLSAGNGPRPTPPTRCRPRSPAQAEKLRTSWHRVAAWRRGGSRSCGGGNGVGWPLAPTATTATTNPTLGTHQQCAAHNPPAPPHPPPPHTPTPYPHPHLRPAPTRIHRGEVIW